MNKYEILLQDAIKFFWDKRSSQILKQKELGKTDAGNRGAVTGGKQLDGFIDLLTQVSLDSGIPESWIYTTKNTLPGYFRPTKKWDFLIISHIGELICCIELKSHIGSFGNNFNNRTEESLGNAIDIWTAYRENIFPNQTQPFVGYIMIAEKSDDSVKKKNIKKVHFDVLEDFQNTSYLDRYMILCQKLMRERHYTSTALIWTSENYDFGSMSEDISLQSFLKLFQAYISAFKKGKNV